MNFKELVKPTNLLAAGYLAVGLGVLLGATGSVKVGSAGIAIGAALVSYSKQGSTRVERFLPLALAVALLVLAIALPSTR